MNRVFVTAMTGILGIGATSVTAGVAATTDRTISDTEGVVMATVSVICILAVPVVALWRRRTGERR